MFTLHCSSDDSTHASAPGLIDVCQGACLTPDDRCYPRWDTVASHPVERKGVFHDASGYYWHGKCHRCHTDHSHKTFFFGNDYTVSLVPACSGTISVGVWCCAPQMGTSWTLALLLAEMSTVIGFLIFTFGPQDKTSTSGRVSVYCWRIQHCHVVAITVGDVVQGDGTGVQPCPRLKEDADGCSYPLV